MKMRNFNGGKKRPKCGRLFIKTLFFAGIILCTSMWIGLAAAQEKSVTEEILDILMDRGQITEGQYDEMMKKARAEKEEIEGKDADFKAYWKEGIRLESKDKQFKIKLGGRFHVDWAVLDPEDDIETAFEDKDIDGFGAEFRRARFYVAGTIYDVIEFKTEYDFSNGEGDAEFKDVWLGLKKVPFIGHVKVGHMKEPFSIEASTSGNHLTFMERGLPNAFLGDGRNTGIMFHNPALENRMTWAVGVFEDSDKFGESFDDFSDFNITARVTGLPWYADEGSKLLHLGFSYSHQFRSENDTPVRFRARPEAHITDARLVDTGEIAADDVDLINPELALVCGPFSFQGEYFQAFLDSESADDPDFRGYYVYASYFLTGEHRPYKTSRGCFDRVKPKKNFHPLKGGCGAWEIGLRYSDIDLTDEAIEGGEEYNFTSGLNWYLNPNVRCMFNYIYANLDDRADVDDGDVNIFQGRFQIDF